MRAPRTASPRRLKIRSRIKSVAGRTPSLGTESWMPRAFPPVIRIIEPIACSVEYAWGPFLYPTRQALRTVRGLHFCQIPQIVARECNTWPAPAFVRSSPLTRFRAHLLRRSPSQASRASRAVFLFRRPSPARDKKLRPFSASVFWIFLAITL